MPLSRRCGCDICRYQNDPISSRVIRTHLIKYGQFNNSSSPLSSPCKHPEVFQDRPENQCPSPHETERDDVVEPTSSANAYIQEDLDSSDSSENGTDVESSIDASDSEHSSVDERQSTDIGWSFNYDKTIYSSGVAIQKLPNSNLTLLQWLGLNFKLFASHPSFSKQTFTENLKLQKKLQIDEENVLPSSYCEARKLIQPYLVPKHKYHVCINDCVVFRNSEKFRYADLNQCPVCEQDRYVSGSDSIPMRTFVYIPIGPRLARYYGETNLAKIIQSHPGDSYNGTEMFDIHQSPAWKSLYSQDGYFKGDKMGISLALELDGVNPYHNIGVIYSMTPIMLTILNLPRHIRNSFGNINLVGIIPGKEKNATTTSQDVYVELLVDELLYLSVQLIVNITMDLLM